jgi:hypothetical protein
MELTVVFFKLHKTGPVYAGLGGGFPETVPTSVRASPAWESMVLDGKRYLVCEMPETDHPQLGEIPVVPVIGESVHFVGQVRLDSQARICEFEIWDRFGHVALAG